MFTRRTFILITAGLLAVGCAALTQESQVAIPQAIAGTQMFKGPHLVPGRWDFGAVVFNDEILVVGGLSQSGQMASNINKYSFQKGSWETIATDLRPRSLHASVQHDGRIFVLGGQVHRGANSCEIYEIATGSIREMPRLPREALKPAAVVYEGKIYVFGGYREPSGTGIVRATGKWKTTKKRLEAQYLPYVQVYDIGTQTWSQGPQMSGGKLVSATLVGDVIFVIGGYGDNQWSYTVEVFDPRTETWVDEHSCPVNLLGHSAVGIGEAIYLFGSARDPSIVLKYNTVEDSWIRIQETGFMGRISMAALEYYDNIFLIGGDRYPQAIQLWRLSE